MIIFLGDTEENKSGYFFIETQCKLVLTSRGCDAVLCRVTVIVGAQCTAERCAAVGVGERHRETLCIAFNGTLLDAGQCDPDTRPDNVEGCQYDACVTTWSTSSWSKVPYSIRYTPDEY